MKHFIEIQPISNSDVFPEYLSRVHDGYMSRCLSPYIVLTIAAIFVQEIGGREKKKRGQQRECNNIIVLNL